MSKASQIESEKFIQQVEQKKEIEAQKEIEDIINKAKNQQLTAVQAKYEMAKLSTIAKDIKVSADLKNKINDILQKLEDKIPDIRDKIDEELMKELEAVQQGFTGEGMNTEASNNDNLGLFSSSDEYDQYKVDGNSTISTFL